MPCASDRVLPHSLRNERAHRPMSTHERTALAAVLGGRAAVLPRAGRERVPASRCSATPRIPRVTIEVERALAEALQSHERPAPPVGSTTTSRTARGVLSRRSPLPCWILSERLSSGMITRGPSALHTRLALGLCCLIASCGGNSVVAGTDLGGGATGDVLADGDATSEASIDAPTDLGGRPSDSLRADDAIDATMAADQGVETALDAPASDRVLPDGPTADALLPSDAGASDAAISPDGADATTPSDAPACLPSHPLLDAGSRFCAPGQCYCPPSGVNGDSCLPAGTASACCPARSVVCASNDAGPVCPVGTHPLVDGGARFCPPGRCYCPLPGAGSDSCLPAESADMCCPGRTVVCAPGDAGATCPAGTHPLLDAGARFCAPGHCFCPPTDSCRPSAVAQACCPVTVVCN